MGNEDQILRCSASDQAVNDAFLASGRFGRRYTELVDRRTAQAVMDKVHRRIASPLLTAVKVNQPRPGTGALVPTACRPVPSALQSWAATNNQSRETPARLDIQAGDACPLDATVRRPGVKVGLCDHGAPVERQRTGPVAGSTGKTDHCNIAEIGVWPPAFTSS